MGLLLQSGLDVVLYRNYARRLAITCGVNPESIEKWGELYVKSWNGKPGFLTGGAISGMRGRLRWSAVVEETVVVVRFGRFLRRIGHGQNPGGHEVMDRDQRAVQDRRQQSILLGCQGHAASQYVQQVE